MSIQELVKRLTGAEERERRQSAYESRLYYMEQRAIKEQLHAARYKEELERQKDNPVDLGVMSDELRDRLFNWYVAHDFELIINAGRYGTSIKDGKNAITLFLSDEIDIEECIRLEMAEYIRLQRAVQFYADRLNAISDKARLQVRQEIEREIAIAQKRGLL